MHVRTTGRTVDECAEKSCSSPALTMDPVRVAAGALTGFVVGMTGVGGGALMTPILLLLFGTAPLTAVGTDLWFAAITKLAVSGLHLRRRLIDWPIVEAAVDGKPARVAADRRVDGQSSADRGERVMFVRSRSAWRCACRPSACCSSRVSGRVPIGPGPMPACLRTLRRSPLDLEMGRAVDGGDRGALGVLVTLTSVGAGALGAVCPLPSVPARGSLRPGSSPPTSRTPSRWLSARELGHLAVSHVDGGLLRDLLVGSIPAALAGAALSGRVPHAFLRTALGAMLLVVGLLMLGAAIR